MLRQGPMGNSQQQLQQHQQLQLQQQQGGQLGFVLRAESVNATAWSSFKLYLHKTEANVLFVQELWLLDHELGEASQWVLRQGWHMIASPSLPGVGKGKSAGVAILVRNHIGLRQPDDGVTCIVPGRLVAAVADFPGLDPVQLYCVYLHDCVGLDVNNTTVLRQLGVHAQEQDHMVMVGGDFNMEPTVMMDADFAWQIGASIVCPTLPTCTSTGGDKVYDYFIMSEALIRRIAEVQVVDTTLITTHSPSAVVFHPTDVDLQILTFEIPPVLPHVLPFGPAPLPQDWSAAQEVVDAATVQATSAPFGQAKVAFDSAYRVFANTFEKEIAEQVGVFPQNFGTRGREPRLKWDGIQHRKKDVDDIILVSKAWRWIVAKIEVAGSVGPPCSFGRDLDGNGLPKQHRLVEGFLQVCHKIAHAKPMGLGIENGFDQCWFSFVTLLNRAVEHVRNESWDQAVAELWANELGSLLDHAKSAAALALKEEQGKRTASWAAWCDAALVKGAKQMHRHTKVQLPWVPTTVMGNGLVTADPQAVLRAYVDELLPYWQTSPSPPEVRVPDRACIGRIPPDKIVEASLSFPVDTSQSLDGFHVRHFALLPMAGLVALSGLMMILEMLGVLPKQVALLIVALIPKGVGKSGMRPIVLFSSFYRLWAKCRKEEADRWFVLHDRPYFACGKGRSSEDVVWRQAVKAEAAKGKGKAALSVLWDIRKFFENAVNRF